MASAVTPIVTRSRGRFCISATKPPPASPSRFAAGTRTSAKNSSEVSWACMPSLSRFRPRVKPGMPRSATSRLMPRCPAAGSVRATTITMSASWPLEMKVFWPFST